MSDLYWSKYTSLDRVLLATWCTFVLLAGIVGNLLTLTTSLLLSPTSDVDRFTTTILRNLAVSDLLYLATRVLPSLISHIAGGWILGSFVCTAEGYIYIIPVLVSMALILCLSLVKVLVCLQPLRAHMFSSRSAWVLATGIWIQSTVPKVISAIGGMKVIVNQEIGTICEVIIDRENKLQYTLGVVKNIQIWVPAFLILPCNLLLWVLAYRYTRSHHISSRKAIVTILSISLLFVISWIPTVMEEGWRVFSPDPHIPLWFNKAHINFYFISSFGNPLLYALINRRYREQIKKTMPTISNSKSNEVKKKDIQMPQGNIIGTPMCRMHAQNNLNSYSDTRNGLSISSMTSRAKTV